MTLLFWNHPAFPIIWKKIQLNLKPEVSCKVNLTLERYWATPNGTFTLRHWISIKRRPRYLTQIWKKSPSFDYEKRWICISDLKKQCILYSYQVITNSKQCIFSSWYHTSLLTASIISRSTEIDRIELILMECCNKFIIIVFPIFLLCMPPFRE